MATLSQFRKKSKYITESGSKKNVGQDGTRNIVKKTFGKYAIPDDGGKKGQLRIEREYNLNNTKKSNTSKLNLSNTKNIVDKDKFSDVRKFQDLNKRAKEILNKSNNTVSNVSNQNNINKIPKNEVKPVKINNVIKDVNTKPIRNVNLLDVKPNTSSLNLKNNIKNSVSLPNFVRARTKQGNIITQNLSNYKDPEVDKLIRDAENLKNPKSLKAYKQARKDFKTFLKNPQVVKRVSPFAKAASGVFAALDGRSDYKASRDMGYNKAQSVARAVTMGLGKYIGATKGSLIGGKVGNIPGFVAGGYYGYKYGGKGAETAFDALVSTKGRKKLKKTIQKTYTNFMDNVRGKK